MPPAAGIRDAVHPRAAPSLHCPDSAAAQSTAINVSASRCSSRRTSTGSLEDAVRRSREILQRQLAARANRGAQCPKKDPKPSDHDRPNSPSLRKTQDRCERRVFRRDSLIEISSAPPVQRSALEEHEPRAHRKPADAPASGLPRCHPATQPRAASPLYCPVYVIFQITPERGVVKNGEGIE